MKTKSLNFKQIEWWMVSIVFLLSILGRVLEINNDYNFGKYIARILVLGVMLGAFYLFHMKVLVNYRKNGLKAKAVLFSVLILLGSWIACTTLYVNAENSHTPFVKPYFVAIALYAAYLVLVSFLKLVFLQIEAPNYTWYNALRLVLIYVVLMLFLINSGGYTPIFVNRLFVVIIPLLLVVVLYNYTLIYRLKQKHQLREAKLAYWALPALMVILLSIVAAEYANNVLQVIMVGAIAVGSLLLIINPLCEYFFKKHEIHLNEIDTLKIEIGEKTSNLKHLIHQINPHFLFNALNTIYGISLQENADKTAESVQKLGDMMRFMLRENEQARISVRREVDYMINYVDFQQMRIQDQEDIEIIFSRKNEHCTDEIAPMLLIPFIENAFKHGISLQEKSWVKISLRYLEGSLHLDVNNSIHRKDENDPERLVSGIGLKNVKERLQHMYPDQHQLMIRENELEYFVHLSVNLRDYQEPSTSPD